MSIELAVKEAGSQAKLARKIGVSRAYVNKMLKEGHVPDKQIKAIEKATGVPRQSLRPDLYD